jgi:fructosamine-3-kinase
MALSGSLIELLSRHLSEHLGRPVDIENERAVGGGSINDAYRLETNEGPFFVKVNNHDAIPSFFEAEADGLARLQGTNTLRVPRVIAHGEDHDDAYLLMEHIEHGTRNEGYWVALGRSLARMHRHTQEHFGLERPNYIGTLKQLNEPVRSATSGGGFATFFQQRRLEPMVKMARDKRKLDDAITLRFERLYSRLGDLFPPEPPALLHGDLWKENCLVGTAGEPVLIDPAVYFGHREMDIAMTQLFGGFDEEFYTAYNSEWPLEQGWEGRMDLCNLYPLLVHVNLFGGGYVAQLNAALQRYL